jgi:signal recognition particle receptor subunit beta
VFYWAQKGDRHTVASQVRVWAELTAVGVDVPQGSTQFWQTTGAAAEYGRLVQYVAQPLHLVGFPGTNQFELHDISHEVDSQGARRVLFQVTSKGSNPFGSYGIFLIYTDVIP